MNSLLLLVPISLVLLGVAFWAFAWAVRRGQFDDLDTPALAILAESPDAGAVPRTPPRADSTQPGAAQATLEAVAAGAAADPDEPACVSTAHAPSSAGASLRPQAVHGDVPAADPQR